MLHNYAQLKDALQSLPGWQAECVTTFVTRISDPAFPCTFAKSSITRQLLYFAFVPLGGDREAAWDAATEAMIAYAELEKKPDPYRVLVLCLDHRSRSWDEDDTLLWEFCGHLQDHDPEPGNPRFPVDLNQPDTSIPFMGMPWFINVNSPVHTQRSSRNTTGRLAFVIQRTDSFAGLAPQHQHDTVRETIRSRIGQYDVLPASPALHGYADNPNGIEWKQFHLPETNEQQPPARCPYHAVTRA